MDLDADHHHRPLGRRQLGQRLRRRLLHRAGAHRHLDRAHRRQRDLAVHHVARHLEVDRQRVQAADVDGVAHLLGGRLRVVEHGLVGGDLAEDPALALEALDLVVDEDAARALVLARAAGEHQHRRLLGVGGGDRVDHVEGAGAVGDAGHPRRRTRARRAAGREADPGLVGEGAQGDPRVLVDHLAQAQDEVAGDAEDVPHPGLDELVEQEAAERRLPRRPLDRVLVQAGTGRRSSSSAVYRRGFRRVLRRPRSGRLEARAPRLRPPRNR